MAGALNSGSDIIFELSTRFMQRVLHERMRQIDTQCFAAQHVPITYHGQEIVLDEVRRAVLSLDSVSFSHDIAADVIENVFLNLHLTLVHAQVRYAALFGDEWKTLDELGISADERRTTIAVPITSIAEPKRVTLTLDATALPAYLPPDLAAQLGERLFLPFDFLDQTVVFNDQLGQTHEVRLLDVTLESAEIKSVDDGHLAIGILLEVSQDADPMVPRPSLLGYDWAVVQVPDDLVAHRCGLPTHRIVFEEDIVAFRSGFTESLVDELDWALALDAYVVDAIIRGLPSLGINQEGDAPTDNCPHPDAARAFCLNVTGLAPGLVHLHAHGEAFYCDDAGVDVIPNDFYEVCLDYDVGLSLSNSGRLSAHAEATAARMCGDDAGFDIWLDLLEELPEQYRSRDLAVAGIPTRFGDPGAPQGRLTLEAVEVRTHGLVLAGSSSVRALEPAFAIAEEVFFASGCQAEGTPARSTTVIANQGRVALHICPPWIRADPDHPGDEAFFRIVEPPEFTGDGSELVLGRGRELTVGIECTGEAGHQYLALLDIPTSAGARTVVLNADFHPCTLGPVQDELGFADQYTRRGCNWPAFHPVVQELEITNEGPGNMEICSLRLSASIRDVFRAVSPRPFGPGPARIVITFAPPWGVGDEYSGTLRIVTNAGERATVNLTGQIRYAMDELIDRLAGSYALDMFCGDADWDAVIDSHGRILDVQELGRIFQRLGGVDCCPPPLGPACQCVDLLELALQDVPPAVLVDLSDASGIRIASALAGQPSRLLITPMDDERGYALSARMSRPQAGSAPSRVTMRRWLAQQEGQYRSTKPLADLAVVDDFVYAVGPGGIDVIRWATASRPKLVGQVPLRSGATSVVSWRDLLLTNHGGLRVHSLANPRAPLAVSVLRQDGLLKSVFAGSDQESPFVYGLTHRLQVFDLTDARRPRDVRAVRVSVEPNGAVVTARYLYLFGAKGVEVFDRAHPDSPRSAGLLRVRQPVLNAVLAGKFLLLIHDAGKAHLVDVSRPMLPQLACQFAFEEWVREYVPVAGNVCVRGGYGFFLREDRHGIRAVRLRLNTVRGPPSEESARPPEPRAERLHTG